MSSPHKKVVVIGAGISGLVCAYRLKSLGADVLLLERSGRVGGVIRSEFVDGFLIERGPNSARGTPELLELVRELGLADQLLRGDRRAPAFVYFGGQLHRVPMGPGALLGSRLLSARGKLRLLAEPFIRKRADRGEESVASFFKRRLGAEVAHRLVAPFVSGIYAGDSERLSAQAAFPQIVELETAYGSLFRGALGRPRPARGERLCSFRLGMASLPEALAARLEGALALGCETIGLSRRAGGGFEVSFDGNSLSCGAVAIAAPAYEAARLVAPISEGLGGLLREIEYSPLSVIHLAYDESSIGVRLEGFGFLAAPGELSILGCVYSSKIFEGRAPEGRALLTVFVGGALNPGAVNMSDEELIAMAHSDLKRVLRIAQEPRPIAITRYERAIPQYNLGHLDRVRRLEEMAGRIGGLRLIGNYLRGVSIGDCIREAECAARSLSSVAAGVL